MLLKSSYIYTCMINNYISFTLSDKKRVYYLTYFNVSLTDGNVSVVDPLSVRSY